MNLIIAIVPVLSLIVLMAFFKMSGDKSSIISLVVTMLIAFFGFHFPLDDLLFSFLYGAMKAVIIRKSKFPQNPKRSVRFSGKRTKRSVQKRKARNTQKAETKVL